MMVLMMMEYGEVVAFAAIVIARLLLYYGDDDTKNAMIRVKVIVGSIKVIPYVKATDRKA